MKEGSKELLVSVAIKINKSSSEALNILRLIISNVAKSKVSHSGHVLVLTTEEKKTRIYNYYFFVNK